MSVERRPDEPAALEIARLARAVDEARGERDRALAERDENAVRLQAQSVRHAAALGRQADRLAGVLREQTKAQDALARAGRRAADLRRAEAAGLDRALQESLRSWRGLFALPGRVLAARRRLRRAKARLARERDSLPFAAWLDGIESAYATGGLAEAQRRVESIEATAPQRAAALVRLAKIAAPTDAPAARRLGAAALELDPKATNRKWFAFLLFGLGYISEADELLRSLPADLELRPSEAARARQIDGLHRLATRLPDLPARRIEPAYDPVPGRIVYLGASALPHNVSGYTIRSQAMVDALDAAGWDVVCATRPGYPDDRPDAVTPGPDGGDGMQPWETLPGPHRRKVGLDRYLAASADIVEARVREARPVLIHAASNHEVAIPALIAARRLGVPFVYEVRGLWELTASSSRPGWEDTERFALDVRLETFAAANADAVMTLTNALADELASRGVERGRIALAPNAVDPLLWSPRPRDGALAARYGLAGAAFVVGYVGSVVGYEGLDDLLRAVAHLRDRELDAKGLIVGDGDALAALRRQAEASGLDAHVVFAGRVEPRDAPAHLALLDAVALPRKPLKVCEVVSPLKPLEAMAAEVPVVVSDVAALREMVEDGVTGLVHRAGDPTALADALESLARDPGLAQALARAGREHVVAHRGWMSIARDVGEVYGRLLPPVRRTRSSHDASSAAQADGAPGGRAPGPSGPPARDVRVACILDEFSFRSFDPECRLRQLTPRGWRGELEDFQPDLLLVESAWGGKGNLWDAKIGQKDRSLEAIVAWCRARTIPTLFWNKEDPVHFSTFLAAAALFDIVFTTDVDCIASYKAALGHDAVFVLPFACQPAIHNPVECHERRDAFCFAGAYYTRYPERMRDLEDFIGHLPHFRPFEIFDRNLGKTDPRYAFPERYQPYIVGSLPFDRIDEAYKGYKYAVNLNSVKTSQSMIARRVFELMACNTLVVSNHARGLKVLFGELVIASDSGRQIVERLVHIVDHGFEERLRLAALRKVMMEHTYGARLDHMLSKAFGPSHAFASRPSFAVVGRATEPDQLARLIAAFARQKGVTASLVVVVPDAADLAGIIGHDPKIRMVPESSIRDLSLAEVAGSAVDWIAAFSTLDHYGANYLADIEVATRYRRVAVIGKAARHALRDGRVTRQGAEPIYGPATSLPARCAAVARAAAGRLGALGVVTMIDDCRYEEPDQFAIDPFNYCEGGGSATDAAMVSAAVDDLPLDTGMALGELARAEGVGLALEVPQERGPGLDAAAFARLFGRVSASGLTLRLSGDACQIVSVLQEGTHAYLYAADDIACADLLKGQPGDRELPLHLVAGIGLRVSLVLIFLNSEGARVGHVILAANRNHAVALPHDAVVARLGLRVLGSGECRISRLAFSHINVSPAVFFGQSDCLLVTSAYPSYDDLYRNAFVHTRVAGYARRGVAVDVFRCDEGKPVSFHEFRGVEVTTGPAAALTRMVSSGRYRHILVHFLNADMWPVLRDAASHARITIWLHGSDVQPWWRRAYGDATSGERERLSKSSESRERLWREVLCRQEANLHFVFVSAQFFNQVVSDYGVSLPPERYSIIHNPIDTDLFQHVAKTADQRGKILSIRSYASATYANDLSAQAIEVLSARPYFNELSFKIVGDGRLFEQTTAPLRRFDNVSIERRFLTHVEMAEMHRDYGVFLCPSRMDTHGVSRDEAMSSGLVPVTTRVGAVPEFVDADCGFMAEPESAEGLVDGIAALYDDPSLFLRLSSAAAARVRRQSSSTLVLEREMRLIASV